VQCSFTSELWLWDARASDSWTFATVPVELSEELHEVAMPGRGFGSIRVEVSIGKSTWQTSVFPDKQTGCYTLPIKAAIRRAESVSAGDCVRITLSTV